ncbi:uncharacterized protein LOC134769458 [Penaeus indicus]|uniref:uncharacterized protein LOC134769458 n=1 Tax=Penaeus indicus TaxID=29960 RepID=UPI00300D5CF0
MRRVQVAVAVNIVRETPSHLTPRRYATNLLSVLARAENASRAAQTSAEASHAPARAACSEAPALLAPSSLLATTSATTASRDGNSSAAVVQALCTTQHSGDVDASSRAAEKRTGEAQQSMRGAGHPSERHPLQTSVGAAYPVGMMRESQHPNKRVTTVSYQLHTVAATRNIAAQCPRKVVAGFQHPTKALTAVQCTVQTARGSGHRRGAVSAARHIVEPGGLVQHSRKMTTSAQTVCKQLGLPSGKGRWQEQLGFLRGLEQLLNSLFRAREQVNVLERYQEQLGILDPYILHRLYINKDSWMDLGP